MAIAAEPPSSLLRHRVASATATCFAPGSALYMDAACVSMYGFSLDTPPPLLVVYDDIVCTRRPPSGQGGADHSGPATEPCRRGGSLKVGCVVVEQRLQMLSVVQRLWLCAFALAHSVVPQALVRGTDFRTGTELVFPRGGLLSSLALWCFGEACLAAQRRTGRAPAGPAKTPVRAWASSHSQGQPGFLNSVLRGY